VSNTGTLYIVATPLGNLADISQRALTTLTEVDLIAAEDTRHSRKLLQHYAINTPMQSLHEHNEAKQSEMLIQHLLQGHDIALISDAGTPLISDPGQRLVMLAHQHAIRVSPIPGPSAVIAALSVAGFAGREFIFMGFLPTKKNERTKILQTLATEPRTLVFYEAPHRIEKFLQSVLEVMSGEREVVLAREISKIYETVKRDNVSHLLSWLQQDPQQQKGEFVVVIAGADVVKNEKDDVQQAQQILSILLTELPVKQAAKLTAKITGCASNKLYQMALDLR
jgi:16S rRNA (cytidine1402-2'-O)-methyltransferase